ncbi:MAG: hypothetical protein IJJ01_09450 [Firmicutes bacterium]|nr:hypothetical protein [Bacillota bacterium]
MNIYEITDDKKQYMDLLFLADEQEEMIDKYIDTGTMFVLDDNGVKSSIVVLEADQDTLEIKNLATYPAEQHKGYGRSAFCSRL